MRKAILLFVVLALTLGMMCACGNESVEQPTNNTSPSATQPMGTEPVVNTTEPSVETTVPSTEMTEPTEPEAVIPPYLYCEITDGAAFSDGIAWVSFKNPNNGYKENRGLLKTSGEIVTSDALIQLEDLSSGRYGSYFPFSGGCSYVSFGDRFYIVDENGNITAQSPDDGSHYEILAGGDGVYLICQELRSMDVNEDRYGILTATGEWIVELSAESPLGLTQKDGNVKFYYIGEHVFLALQDQWNEDTWYFYNADKNTTTGFYTENTIELYDGVAVHNGLFVYHYYEAGGGQTVVYNVDTEENKLYDFDYDSIFIHDGFIFTANEFNGRVSTDNKIYDLNGNLLLEYSKYPLKTSNVPGFYEFNDGCAAVIVQGADKEYYLGFIDLNGEFLFEPYKLSDRNGYLKYSACSSNAVYAGIYDYDGEYREVIVNSDGTLAEPLYDLGDSTNAYTSSKVYYYTVEFSEGYMRKYTNELGCYIGTDGFALYPYIRNAEAETKIYSKPDGQSWLKTNVDYYSYSYKGLPNVYTEYEYNNEGQVVKLTEPVILGFKFDGTEVTECTLAIQATVFEYDGEDLSHISRYWNDELIGETTTVGNNLVLITEHEPYGELEKNTFVYDKRGNLLEAQSVQGTLIYQDLYTYDEYDNLLSHVYKVENDSSCSKYTYTSDGLLQKVTVVDEEGRPWQYTVYQYSADGILEQSTSIYTNSYHPFDIGHCVVYEYDGAGNLSKEFRCAKDGTVTDLTSYTYEERAK